MEEYLDVLTREGSSTGVSKPRNLVHKDGDFHRAVQVSIYVESTNMFLMQKRADSKDSWPGLWDFSAAGHISAGDTSLLTARKELEEELGLSFPEEAFEYLFYFLQRVVINNGTFINNEFNDVYLITIVDPIPLEAFTLQESEVSAVKYISPEEYWVCLKEKNPAYILYNPDVEIRTLFATIENRYNLDPKIRIRRLRTQLSRYVPVKISAELNGLSDGDLKALPHIIRAAHALERLFTEQVYATNPELEAWLLNNGENSEMDLLKLSNFQINKGPWSVLDEDQPFLSSTDSPLKRARVSTREVSGWDGVEYRVTFPQMKPVGANFYPQDMDKEEFDRWKSTLGEAEAAAAVGFFTVIRRDEDRKLRIVKYSEEYAEFLLKASEHLRAAASVAETPSLKQLLSSKADSFLSNEYYDSDIAWIELDSDVDVTIGPYETYEDGLYGYKATFEAFIGVRDQAATEQVKLYSAQLQSLEDNLPLDDKFKSKNVKASPIRVIQLLYNSGDVKGPQTVAFNLPNDEKIVKERGSAMVMLKNVSKAKFEHILEPIARVGILESQRHFVDFDSFFSHTICHECCHGIGPHTIELQDGKTSTVRLELQEFHAALEEAKADIVGLWALQFLMEKGLVSEALEKSMYVSFLAGCFRSIRFGLEEAHGKGQALQFNWIYNKGGFELNDDGTFSVVFDKVKDAVTSLSTEIMTIQARGDKAAAEALLEKYGTMTVALERILTRIKSEMIPVDIVPSFDVLEKLGVELPE